MEQPFDALELQIQGVIRAVDNKWKEMPVSNVAWTRAIKGAVCEAGKQRGYLVYAAEPRTADAGEWLFDMTWQKRIEKNVMVELQLALECVWTPNEAMLLEFQKLIVSRAQHRVMLFWAVSDAVASSWLARLIDQVTKFPGSGYGDRYLFGYYVGSKHPMHFRLHVHR